MSIRYAGLLILLCLVSGCATYTIKDRQDYIDAHPNISAEDRQDILNGVIRVGMSKEVVRASLGLTSDPKYYTSHRSYIGSSVYETWDTTYFSLTFKNDTLNNFYEKSPYN